jgi:hypothetical protein
MKNGIGFVTFEVLTFKMHNVYNVISDMEVRFPNHLFSVDEGNAIGFWVATISRGTRQMTIEMEIDHIQESVMVAVLHNQGFMRTEFTRLLDSLLNAFD